MINRLQLYKGGKEFNCMLKSSKTPSLVPVDFAAHAKSMGADGEHVNSTSELEEAFNDVVPRFHTIGTDSDMARDHFYETQFGKKIIL